MTDDAKTSDFLSLRKLLHATASKVLLNKEDADDALQELFIRVWQNGRTDADEPQKRAFMFTSLRNICIDMIRRRRLCATVEILPPDEYSEDGSADTAGQIDDRDRIENIHQLAQRLLPGKMLKVFELYTMEELDYTEIAERLDIGADVARSYMSRARKILKNHCNNLLNS